MKKRKYVILGVMAAFSLTGCSTPDTSQTLPERLNEIWQSQQSQAESGSTQQTTATEFDYDLTQMSSTVVYSQITDMTMVPEEYAGKTIKMEGRFEIYGDPDKEDPYLGCIVNDATACCSVGLRFVLTDDYTSADFPLNGSDIIITGVFETYEYQGCTFGEVQNAQMTVISEGPEAAG